MRKINLLQLLVLMVISLGCEKDEDLGQVSDINDILGSSGRSLFKVSVSDTYNYINNNGEIAFEDSIDYGDDFYNDLAVYGERIESEELTTYEGILDSYRRTNYSENSQYIDGQYISYYGIYGKDNFGQNLPENCTYTDYNSSQELTGYNIGDFIKVKYISQFYVYGSFSSNSSRSYYTTNDEEITNSSPYLYSNYITVPFYLKEKTNKIKYGYINTKGEIVIPASYDYANSFYDKNIAIVGDKQDDDSYNYDYYLTTKKGERVSNDSYYSADFFLNGLAAVKYESEGDYIYVDADGLPVITKGYDNAYPFVNGIAAVEKNDYWGFINKNGDEVVPLRFGSTSGICTYDLIAVSDETRWEDEEMKWYFIDKEGNRAFSDHLEFDGAQPFLDGLAAVEIADRWRFINTSGEYEFNTSFDATDGFADGYAVVRDENELWGYINKKGEYAIISQYLSAEEFVNGVAKVIFTDETWGYIDKNAQEIWRSEETIDNLYYGNEIRSTSVEENSEIEKYIKRSIRIN